MTKNNLKSMAAKLNIIYMGTPEFAIAPLLSLIADPSFNITAVITREDKKTGRKQILTPPPVKIASQKFNIPVLQPTQYRGNQEITTLLRGLNPHFIVVTAYGHILPSKILQIPKYGCVNIHGSLLPKYRGASPIESAIINGDKETGISIMKMTEKMDAGPLYSLFRIPIDPRDTAEDLRHKLSLLASTHLTYVLKDIASKTVDPIEQNNQNATYCKKITKNDGNIDLRAQTAEEIINQIRAYDPWPGCILNFKEKKIKIVRAEAKAESSPVKPYELVEIGKNKIGIGTKKNLLIPLIIQLEGKKPVPIQEFLLGNKALLARLLQSAR